MSDQSKQTHPGSMPEHSGKEAQNKSGGQKSPHEAGHKAGSPAGQQRGSEGQHAGANKNPGTPK